MAQERIGNAIRTISGRMMYPFDPRPEEIELCDIAHSLALLPRYTGHTVNPVSVAEHSVYVSQHVPASLAFPALMHDAAEAYLNDLAAPNKGLYYVCLDGVNFTLFEECEDRLLRVIFHRFNCPWPDDYQWAAIKVVDKSVYDRERDPRSPCVERFAARCLFLDRFAEVCG
jgi:hypothetical protein